MADQVLKTVRITDNIKVEVLQQGKKRKYALFYDTDNTKSEKYDVAMSDDDVIKESLLEYGRLQSSKGKPLGQLPQFYYKVIQDPYKDPFIKRTYGNGDRSPYYLNNGCSINIEWEGWANSDPIITSSNDDADAKKGSNNASLVYAKSVTVYLPKGFTENGGKGYLVWTDTGLRYNDDKNVYKNSLDKGQKNGAIILKPRDSDKDSEIVEHIIASFVSKVTHLHGYDYRGLKLCSPDTEACSLIPYKSPLEPPSPTPIQTPVGMPVGTPVGMSQSTKIKFTIDGLPSEIILKAKEDLDTFTIWTGPIPKINNGSGNVDVDDDLDDEYKEAEFIGDDEAPVDIKDPDPISNTIEDNGSNKVNDTTVYNPPSGAGGGVNLPKGKNAYSHNETQGYNLIDSKWYGDILTSAKQHIDTPTFDVPLTKRGKLGCASWVSIVFYRAFGVHIKDGKPVVPVPKSIGKFGSTGTGELGGWFAQNPNIWIKIPWREGQPGDIINTTRGPKEAGHVGIVMDTKNADGSWNIASNSSYGFGNKNDPFGCGKMNYSIKKWQTVTDRNPSGTFCWRYKGPKLSVGQTA